MKEAIKENEKRLHCEDKERVLFVLSQWANDKE